MGPWLAAERRERRRKKVDEKRNKPLQPSCLSFEDSCKSNKQWMKQAASRLAASVTLIKRTFAAASHPPTPTPPPKMPAPPVLSFYERIPPYAAHAAAKLAACALEVRSEAKGTKDTLNLAFPTGWVVCDAWVCDVCVCVDVCVWMCGGHCRAEESVFWWACIMLAHCSLHSHKQPHLHQHSHQHSQHRVDHA